MLTPGMTRCCANWSRACDGCAGTVRRWDWRASRPSPRPACAWAKRRCANCSARPLAEPGAPGAWYRELRLVSFDGTTIDVPDLPALERDFGRPSSPRGVSGFPQLRLLETGTHAIFAAALAGVATGEITLARRIMAHLQPGMLCLADRAFVGYSLWRDAAATGADLLWRARHIFPCLRRLDDGSFLSRLYPSSDHRQRDRDGLTVRVIEYRMPGVPGGDRIYRLVTTLLDDRAAPAAKLAALYHERWEDATVLAEVKVTRPGGRPILRSRPDPPGSLRPSVDPLRHPPVDGRGQPPRGL